MPKLPAINAKMMIQFLNDSGFTLKRQKGSHKFFAHPDGRTATIPDHNSEDLGRGIVRKILNDVEATREDFLNWLSNKKPTS